MHIKNDAVLLKMSTVNATCKTGNPCELKTIVIKSWAIRRETFGSSLRADMYELEPNLGHGKIMTTAVVFTIRNAAWIT